MTNYWTTISFAPLNLPARFTPGYVVSQTGLHVCLETPYYRMSRILLGQDAKALKAALAWLYQNGRWASPSNLLEFGANRRRVPLQSTRQQMSEFGIHLASMESLELSPRLSTIPAGSREATFPR